MVFGRNMIPVDRINIDAPPDSDARYLALMGRQFPGPFLPYGQEQIIRSARPHFRLVSSTSGRLDYIETIRQWRERFAAPSVRKTLLKLQLLPRWLTSADFRLAFTSGVSANSVCFERELLDHYRLVFEKRVEQRAGVGAPCCSLRRVPRWVWSSAPSRAAALGSAPASVNAPPAPAAWEALDPRRDGSERARAAARPRTAAARRARARAHPS